MTKLLQGVNPLAQAAEKSCCLSRLTTPRAETGNSATAMFDGLCFARSINNRWEVLELARDLVQTALTTRPLTDEQFLRVGIHVTSQPENRARLNSLHHLGDKSGGTFADGFAKFVLWTKGLSELKPLVELRHQLRVESVSRPTENEMDLEIVVSQRQPEKLKKILADISERLEDKPAKKSR